MTAIGLFLLHDFFPCHLLCKNFFSDIFPCMNFLFCLFSLPPITFLMVSPLVRPFCCSAFYPYFSPVLQCITGSYFSRSRDLHMVKWRNSGIIKGYIWMRGEIHGYIWMGGGGGDSVETHKVHKVNM